MPLPSPLPLPLPSPLRVPPGFEAGESASSADAVAVEAACVDEVRAPLSDHAAAQVTPVPWSEARARIFAREL